MYENGEKKMDIMGSSKEHNRLPFFFLTFSGDGVIIHPATVILIEILRDSSGIVYLKIIYKYFSVIVEIYLPLH